ncbi:MAG: hypothetical protein LBH46_00530 [Rickettsiales bacterium]|jgi:hypothetical protein|nr:hypothetical protein [Rickettsiales bacterium]
MIDYTKYKKESKNVFEEKNINNSRDVFVKRSGRPKKPADKIANKKVTLFFSESEYGELSKKAGSLSLSSYLKAIILKDIDNNLK